MSGYNAWNVITLTVGSELSGQIDNLIRKVRLLTRLLFARDVIAFAGGAVPMRKETGLMVQEGWLPLMPMQMGRSLLYVLVALS